MVGVARRLALLGFLAVGAEAFSRPARMSMAHAAPCK